MITNERMAAVDRNAEALGVPRRQLMESSGSAIAKTVRACADSDDRVIIVCGRGNNGGDGFVAARFLDEYDVEVHLLGHPSSITTAIAKANWDALIEAELDTNTIRDSRDLALPAADIIVDAIVGTGITGPLREPAATAVAAINDHPATVISVDVPSGMNSANEEINASRVFPDQVITFHDTKPGLQDLDVPVHIADIGIPAAAELFVGPGDLAGIKRDPHSHKGDAGRMLVIGGGPYVGAPVLSAMASLRMGGDLATVACPDAIADTAQSFSPNLIVRPVEGDRFTPDDVDHLLRLAEEADCVIIGPGLGDEPEALETIESLLSSLSGRCVIDAEALQLVPSIDTSASLICTPHQGELTMMGGERRETWQELLEAVEPFADQMGHTMVVKGRYDIITDGMNSRVNRTGNPGMTVGGTGDVLAGAIGALFSDSTREPIDAAALGAYITGAAGDLAATKKGHGLLATDVIDAIPGALRRLDQ